ncbi:sucrase ferredoxin [Streptomyces sp. YIM 98790]|uniref:sucrase ferredoxin n=1 Tax=Streptomyces sp. YIM 98790 TaxID=2689077 RepID=UPI00140E49D3|nr:sucrase ferredoxin [Streptomyces sp. YIM 98790]
MTTCATASRTAGEPLAGTAATARTWLLIEQPGPWGARALTGSRLDPALGRELEQAAEGTGMRIALIRRPGPHPDPGGPLRRRVFAVHTAPGHGWARTAVLDDPARLRGLDPARLGAGHHDGLWQEHHGPPLVLVCTNGRRDRCCALLGRPLAAELSGTAGADVWEVTHLGGHRFAPTLLVLPHGYTYGRMSAPAVKNLLAEARDGRMVTEGCRGRSTWDRFGQAADLALRELLGEAVADAVDVTGGRPVPEGRLVTLRHTGGHAWRVLVTEETTGPAVPASCGAAPLPQTRLRAAEITPLAR